MSISSDKMFCHIDRLVNHKPITADVFLTNFCNNKCPYCTYGRWELNKNNRYMRYEDFVRYGNRLRELGVKGIILTGGGEPTLDPDFSRITNWLEGNNFRYGINTNFNRLIFFKPDYIKISLDGYDEESYYRRRGVRKYLSVLQNINEYSQWRDKYSPKTKIVIQCVAECAGDIISFYGKNKVLNVDNIVFRPVESTGGDYYHSEEKMRAVDEMKAVMRELIKGDERVLMNFKWQMLDWAEKECTAQWAQIAINEAGDVMYCCHKPYELVGNIMDVDILDKKARAVTNMSMCDIPCRMTAPNNFVAKTQKIENDSAFI